MGEEITRRESEVTKYLDELDMLGYRLSEKLDLVLDPATPNVASMEKSPGNPSLLLTRLRNIVLQLRDLGDRINI